MQDSLSQLDKKVDSKALLKSRAQSHVEIDNDNEKSKLEINIGFGNQKMSV